MCECSTQPARTWGFLFLFEQFTGYPDAGKDLEQLALEAGFANAKHFEIGVGLMGNLVATR